MKASYLIRFDDITPQMNWEIWEKIETICDRYKIKPLLAVVPDNRDQKLKTAFNKENFWDCVKVWQSKGYSIGIHGYQHTYETQNSGIVGLNARSEFAGHPLDLQYEKLKKSISIFKEKNIHSNIFIAPGHSFDIKTLIALEKLEIPYLSDGFFPFPCRRDSNILWIPQQLWKFKPRYLGVWTVCYHLNNWTSADLQQFESDIIEYENSLVSFENIIDLWKNCPRRWYYSLANKTYEKYFHAKRSLIAALLYARRLILRRK